jgi:hypothetical protein
MLKMQLGVAAVMAVAMGLAFLGVDGSAAGFQNKAGAMQITLVLFSFGGVSVRLESAAARSTLILAPHAPPVAPRCPFPLPLPFAPVTTLPSSH